MSKQIDAREFWENKILAWENGRYHDLDAHTNLEALADKASNSLRFRLEAGVRLLAPHLSGKRIVDLGCGSGLIAEKFIDLGAASYRGIDIAENAVAIGNERLEKSGYADRARLEAGVISEVASVEGDIILSLGLLDWLPNQEISQIFACSKGKIFLHSISEKRFSLQQLLHRLYVQISYGYKTGSYRPIYHSINQIKDILQPQGIEKFTVFRHPKLSFGAFIMSFEGKLENF